MTRRRRPTRDERRPDAEPGAPSAAPWTIRYSPRLLSEDYGAVGHAAFELARAAIEKKLKLDPVGYGAPLRSPLQGLFKLKTSHVRIVYHVEAERHEVWTLMIGDRRDIWAHDQPEIADRLRTERTARQARDAQTPTRPSA